MVLDDQVHRRALVTGSTRGVGRGIAEHLSAVGYRVAVNGRSTSRVAEVVAEIDGDRYVVALEGKHLFLRSKYLVSGNWLSATASNFIEINTTAKNWRKRASFVIKSKLLTLDPCVKR